MVRYKSMIISTNFPNNIVLTLICTFIFIGCLYVAVLTNTKVIYVLVQNNTESVPPPVTSNPETLDVRILEEHIQMLNEEQTIYNLDLYGPVTQSTNVIVVQVHTRLTYLKVLIDSLSQVKGIGDALLIFSHDVYLPTINDEIQRINFTRVMQIFFPYSSQAHPDWILPAEQENNRSTNLIPMSSQIKLHWWWKLNFVFDQVKVLENFTGVISFTEEDSYFTPNSLWMLDLMKKAMIENRCGGCQVLSLLENVRLGTAIVSNNDVDKQMLLEDAPNYSQVVVSNWIANFFMSFNRTVWEKLNSCNEIFCSYDDYNWDWTLSHLHTSTKCMEKPLNFLITKWPRVFHTGNCGHHHHSSNCDPNELVGPAVNGTKEYSSLFPETLGNLTAVMHSVSALTPKQAYGGWAYPRVMELCKSMVKGMTEDINMTSSVTADN